MPTGTCLPARNFKYELTSPSLTCVERAAPPLRGVVPFFWICASLVAKRVASVLETLACANVPAVVRTTRQRMTADRERKTCMGGTTGAGRSIVRELRTANFEPLTADRREPLTAAYLPSRPRRASALAFSR